MSKTLKKITAVILVLQLLFTMFIFNVSANELINAKSVNYDDQIAPCWNNVMTTTLVLGFSDDQSKIEAVIRLCGVSGTKYKNGTIKIDRYTGSSWVNVKTWSNQSGSSSVFSFSSTTLTAISNAKYRLTIEITAYNGSSSEVISLSKTSTNS